jgi:beta-glucosidase
LYASVSADAAIPEMEQLFGARLVDHVAVSDVTLKIVAPFGDLKPGDTFHYSSVPSDPRHWAAILQVTGGRVIAVDQDGRPAIVANTLGSGKTLLCAYPLESYLAAMPGVFDKPESTYRIYKAFTDWAGVRPAFRSDQPSVEVRALNGAGRGYAVLANHTAQPQKVTVVTNLPVKSLHQVTPAGLAPIPLHGSSWTVELQPYSGAVVEWQ